MSTNTGEIQPITRDVWTQPEHNRKEVQVIPPVGKVEGSKTKKTGEDKTERRESALSWVNTEPKPVEAIEQIQSYLEETMNVQLDFRVDTQTGQMIVQVLDRETGEVIRQIPPEGLRNLQEKLEELRGILFDGKA